MAWETRSLNRFNKYYTRSRRHNGRVVREYVGGGLEGSIAAEADAKERSLRLEGRRREKEEQAALSALEKQVSDACTAADLLVKALLLSEGYHRHHRGDWRKRNERTKDDSR